MGEPRGQVEAALLLAQVALATGNPIARDLMVACQSVGLREAETQQHLALTYAWLAHVEGRFDEAAYAVAAAREAFGNPKRTGDHARHLLARLAQLEWPEPTQKAIHNWQRELGVL